VVNVLQIAKQILTTRGVNSRVLIEGDRQHRKTVGHVLLADFDGVSKQQVLDACLELDGINILWESSSTGFHLWNLSIRTMDEIALLGLKIGSDSKHVQHGYIHGKWVLRIVPKFKTGSKQYKPAPKLLHTWCNNSLRPQSAPHMRVFQAMTGKTILQKNDFQFEGRSAEVEDYLTMTDAMKRGLRA